MRIWILAILLPLVGAAQLPGSGEISILDVRTETGKTGAYSLSTGRTDFGLPAGEVSLADFYGKTYANISVSPTSRTPPAAGETFIITVTATGAWTLTENQSWITTNKTSGTGSTTVSVTVSANATGSSRNYSILFTLTGQGKTASTSIFQVSS